MLPYTYWMRPDPDGDLRRINEARAAQIYQAFRHLGRLLRSTLGWLRGWAGARAAGASPAGSTAGSEACDASRSRPSAPSPVPMVPASACGACPTAG